MRKEENNQTRGTDNQFSRKNQKPVKHRRGGQVTFGCCCAVIFALSAITVYNLIGKYTDYREVIPLPSSMVSEETSNEKILADGIQQEIKPIGESIFLTENTEKSKEEPEYSEQTIEFALYEVLAHDDDVLLTPDSQGNYALDADKVYAIRWNASLLFHNQRGKVKADVTANSKYLVEEGSTGIITVNLCDYAQDIIYSGEFNIMPTSGDLGIEFCARECRICSYGSYPSIIDSDFVLCFYTSGEYISEKKNGVISADGEYSYHCKADGCMAEQLQITGYIPTVAPPVARIIPLAELWKLWGLNDDANDDPPVL